MYNDNDSNNSDNNNNLTSYNTVILVHSVKCFGHKYSFCRTKRFSSL